MDGYEGWLLCRESDEKTVEEQKPKITPINTYSWWKFPFSFYK